MDDPNHDQETAGHGKGAGKSVDERGAKADVTAAERGMLALLLRAASQPGYVDWECLSGFSRKRE